jgi:hypothetical protein
MIFLNRVTNEKWQVINMLKMNILHFKRENSIVDDRY